MSPAPTDDRAAPPSLHRAVGVPGAVVMGLGSILGTGIFVSLGIAAGVAGPSAALAVVLAAGVATCNGLSSAQLAAAHPLSGGTYEYGYRLIGPAFGFTAGWMFLCAKSASAATAALGFGGYLLAAGGTWSAAARIPLGAAAVVILTAVVMGGISRSSRVNTIIVSITVVGLVGFVAAGATAALDGAARNLAGTLPDSGAGVKGLLHATALMFVAYTGYGRVATLGEEVRDPARSIPRAVVLSLVATMVLYAAVAAVAIGAVGAADLAEATRSAAAPLAVVAERFAHPGVAHLVAAAAITAMLGVLLNLLLGLSRVLLAMARRGDMPAWLAVIDERQGSPRRAVLVTGAAIAALTLAGSVETTWSFSAFTVLVYYALTNLAALRLPAGQRRVPRLIPMVGLVSCAALAFWVEPAVWVAGLALIAAGLGWHVVSRRRRVHPPRA